MFCYLCPKPLIRRNKTIRVSRVCQKTKGAGNDAPRTIFTCSSCLFGLKKYVAKIFHCIYGYILNIIYQFKKISKVLNIFRKISKVFKFVRQISKFLNIFRKISKVLKFVRQISKFLKKF